MTVNTDAKVTASEPNGAAHVNGSEKQAPTASIHHPLGPLTAAEISQSSALIKQQWPEGTPFQFKVITLLEPVKSELVPYLAAEKKGEKTKDIDRRSQVVYYLRNTVSTGIRHDMKRKGLTLM